MSQAESLVPRCETPEESEPDLAAVHLWWSDSLFLPIRTLYRNAIREQRIMLKVSKTVN